MVFYPPMGRQSRGALVVGLLLTTTGLSMPARANETVIREEIGVEVLNIDVVVTDKKGRLVYGLSREDFELRVDGREVPIANFYAVTGSGPSSPLPARNEVAGSAPGREPLHLVVYLDDFYLIPGGRRRVLEDLPDFFDRHLAEGARILLAARDTEIRLLTPFTTDAEELRTALATAAELPTQGIRRRQQRASALEDVRSTYDSCTVPPAVPCRDCFGGMRATARFYGLSVENQKRASLATLEALVGMLGNIDGRKALIHVSDGIQERSGLDVLHYVGEICPERATDLRGDLLRNDSASNINALVARANASRVTIYALEAAGLRGSSAASVLYADPKFVPSSRNDRIRLANLQSTLYFISNETGGRAILNTNRFTSELERVTAELGHYYSLGYQPSHRGQGEIHRISVSAPKRKVKVRYRRSLLHQEAEQLLADKTLGAALFGGGANPLEAEVVAGRPAPDAEGRLVVPLELRLPLSKITRLPGHDSEPGRLTLIVAAPDDGTTAIRKQELLVSWPEEGNPDQDYRFGVHVALPPGEHQLGVGIWDQLAAHGSFLAVLVAVGAEPVAGAAQ